MNSPPLIPKPPTKLFHCRGFLLYIKNKGFIIMITCPYCGAEYHLSEIYVPNALVGRPVFIQKDITGHITNIAGIDSCMTETYNCDYCNKTFDVVVQITTTTIKQTTIDMDIDYSSPLYKAKQRLSEE